MYDEGEKIDSGKEREESGERENTCDPQMLVDLGSAVPAVNGEIFIL